MSESSYFKKEFFRFLDLQQELYVRLCEELRIRKLKIATAESCTGGLLASRIVSVSGISDVYWGSVVSYCKDAKTALAGVPAKGFELWNEVSAECALSMAEGMILRYDLPCAISVTGYAEAMDASFGSAYAAFIVAEKKALLNLHHIQGSRNEVRALLTDIMGAFFLSLLCADMPKKRFAFEHRLFAGYAEAVREGSK